MAAAAAAAIIIDAGCGATRVGAVGPGTPFSCIDFLKVW
jgi:hypothetical protein